MVVGGSTYLYTYNQSNGLPYWSKISLPWWVGCGTSEVDGGCEGSAEEGMQMFHRVDAFWNLFNESTPMDHTTTVPLVQPRLTNAWL